MNSLLSHDKAILTILSVTKLYKIINPCNSGMAGFGSNVGMAVYHVEIRVQT